MGENFLYNEDCFTIEKSEGSIKKLLWLDNIQIYSDSELEGKIQLGEILATVELKNKTLTFVSTKLDIVNQFLKKLIRARGAFELVDDQEEPITIPLNVELRQLSVNIEKGVPEYFILFAQSNWGLDIDQPIPMFDNLSLRDLVESNKKDLAEVWLKHSEYNLYKLVYKQYGNVKNTADFNTVKKRIGIGVVTFCDGRKTTSLGIFTFNQYRTT